MKTFTIQKKGYTPKLMLLVVLALFISQKSMAKEAYTFFDSNLTTTISDTSKVYNVVDEMPQVVGGLNEIYKHIEYPEIAMKNGVEGRVFIQFIVTEDGDVINPKVIKDIGAGCGSAAVKGIKNVKFTPGKLEGKAVRVQFTMPISFKFD